MRTTKQLFALCLFASVLFYFSCKKTDPISTTENLSTNSIEEKFFNSHRTTNPTEKALIDFLKRVNTKDKFVEKTVAKIGYPRWDKAITNTKKKGALNARNFSGDSIQTFYIPFVRDSQNYVNASMIIHASQTDTSFTYRCDWQYAQLENNIESANDAAEHFATFFMVLDKAVFGYNKFNIVDSNLFRTSYGPTKYVRLDSTAASTVNNLYDLVEFCQDVVVFVQYCQFPDSDQCRNGCDWCYQCVQSNHYTYCWEEYVWMGSGSPGGGTNPGSSGNPGGGPTPPDCGVVPVDPLVAGRVVDPCEEGSGWEPLPIDDEPWWSSSPQHIAIAQSLYANLPAGDYFDFDNHITAGLEFQTVSQFYNYISNTTPTVLSQSNPTIINQNEKIEHQKFQIGLAAGVEVSCKVVKNGAEWTLSEVTSSEYGFSLAWSWDQSTFAQNTSGNIITLNVEGYIKYNLFIEGIGTIYKSKRKFIIKINKQTGSIFEAAIG